MKHILLLTACLTALTITVLAQDEADYQKWMKSIGPTSGSLRKNLEAKTERRRQRTPKSYRKFLNRCMASGKRRVWTMPRNSRPMRGTGSVKWPRKHRRENSTRHRQH